MATKQKILFVFFCCLLLTSITVPPAEAQLSRCRRACNGFAIIMRRFCRTIRLPRLRRRCLATVTRGLRTCRLICVLQRAGPNPTPTRDPYN